MDYLQKAIMFNSLENFDKAFSMLKLFNSTGGEMNSLALMAINKFVMDYFEFCRHSIIKARKSKIETTAFKNCFNEVIQFCFKMDIPDNLYAEETALLNCLYANCYWFMSRLGIEETYDFCTSYFEIVKASLKQVRDNCVKDIIKHACDKFFNSQKQIDKISFLDLNLKINI